MANGQTIDYDALAGQHGGTVVVDYDALAKEHGGAAMTDPKAAPSTFMERLAEGFRGPEKVKQVVSEGDLAGAPRFTVPGGSSTPLAQGISEAASAASLGATSELGAPRGRAAGAAVGRVIEAVKEAPGLTRDSVGRFVRKQGVVGISPKGKLKPGTSAAARLVGGAAGGGAGSIGGPVTAAAGALVGEHAGYGLAESFLPAHPDPRLPTVNEAIKAQLAERYPQIGAYRNAVAARAKAAAQQPAAVAPAATLYPEPRVSGPTERPGAMYSVPREQLPGLAASGTPGAADVLRATGNPVLFEPKTGVGYPGPRAAVEVPAEAAVQTSNAIVARGTLQPRIYTDSMGVKWAETPEGVRVSIPKRISEAEVAQYAETKLAEQAVAQEKIKSAPAEIGSSGSIAEFLKSKREASAITSQLGEGFKVVGSSATGKKNPGDLDILAPRFADHDAIVKSLEAQGYEWDGSQYITPKEAKAAGKQFAKEGSQVVRFSGPKGKLDVFIPAKPEGAK